MLKKVLNFALAAGLVATSATAVFAQDAEKNGYKGASRTMLWSTVPIEIVDTTQYKKDGPYVIGFSNASISNSWRVGMLHSIQQAAADNADKIKQLIITDANDDPAKQVSDVQDLISRGVDLLIVSAATAEALDSIVTQAYESGIPVVMVDRRVTSENFTTFITASDWVYGHMSAQWMVEKLGGKGNIVMLPGMAGVSVAETRIEAAKQVFATYPDIKVLDLQYTDWSPAKGKQVMAALIQKYGTDINGVWNDHGLQGSGAIEAMVEAGWTSLPPITCADLNGCVKGAVENKAPAFNYDYPPAMGGLSVQVALDVLAGKPVPKQYEMNVDVALTKGDETVSVKADKWVEDYARLDAPNDLILSTGIPNYDPTTFSVEYPQ
ncbi:substrate-binding domain-containing protein [Planktothrix agardhii 1801]|uniref:substrate-binding domain-containing protein n=1 Tax=Planktothrix agardhii TaxID=1160 RepID=UPI001F17D37B|nr:substrate-binding domain-containing protein [Planktothrix agardhii]MCF3623358.1 substrate-binding domain-containing protein [Planktothrix agardhii 1801]MCF3625896.1 substrate-binding domain-containing protein [Planktothrix agardhii 1801]